MGKGVKRARVCLFRVCLILCGCPPPSRITADSLHLLIYSSLRRSIVCGTSIWLYVSTALFRPGQPKVADLGAQNWVATFMRIHHQQHILQGLAARGSGLQHVEAGLHASHGESVSKVGANTVPSVEGEENRVFLHRSAHPRMEVAMD